MKKTLCILLILYSYLPLQAQDILIRDLDLDRIADTVRLNRDEGTIMCRLSTQAFRPVHSKSTEMDDNSYLKETRNGFEFRHNWMRAGYACQFRFDGKLRKMQLIGMSRYEFGNAANDGSGESSINLLTGDYIGNWNYYDMEHDELIKMKPIKLKMPLPNTYLDQFSEDIYYRYANQCSNLFVSNKKADRKQRKLD
jgi:hypothetical protein